MNTKLVINKKNGLQEVAEKLPVVWHPFVRAIAGFLSYFFHPVFIPVYVIAFLLFIEPFLFVGFNSGEKARILLQAIQMYTFFPLVTVFLLRMLKFISSIKLQHRKDRIIPFIICNIWYFWLWYVWRNLHEIPSELVLFALSIFLASSIGLLFNIYIKISMHSIALGTALAFLCSLGFSYEISFNVYLIIALLICGLVCTARLILSGHSPAEIYWGLGVGVLAVIFANVVG